MPGDASEPLIELRGVGRSFDGTTVLRDIDWAVRRGEHWALLGPNGSGKTTIARIASLRLHPSTGTVRVLGRELGRADVRPMLGRIGYAAAALADQLRPSLAAIDAVMTAKHGALEPWWHEYDDNDRGIAFESMERVGVAHLGDQQFGSLSSGEKQRVLIARALMTGPSVLLLDEPNASLDLGGREHFVRTLDELASHDDAAPMVLITHHIDEIPASFTHGLLVGEGSIRASGRLEQVLTSDALSALFGLPLRVERNGRRWKAWAEQSVASGPDDE